MTKEPGKQIAMFALGAAVYALVNWCFGALQNSSATEIRIAQNAREIRELKEDLEKDIDEMTTTHKLQAARDDVLRMELLDSMADLSTRLGRIEGKLGLPNGHVEKTAMVGP